MNELRINLDPNNAQHRQFGRLVIAESDIRQARETARFIADTITSPHDLLFDALACATVIWYARPFTHTKEYPGIPGCYTKFSFATFKKIHERLILQRNRFEAHMHQAETEVFLIRKEAPITSDGSQLQVRSHSHFVETAYLVPRSFAGVVKLCDCQLERLADQLAELKDRLFP